MYQNTSLGSTFSKMAAAGLFNGFSAAVCPGNMKRRERESASSAAAVGWVMEEKEEKKEESGEAVSRSGGWARVIKCFQKVKVKTAEA